MKATVKWAGWALFGLFMVGLLAVGRPTWLLDGPTSTLIVSGHSMDGTYRSGDLIITRRQAGYGVGDIIGFEVPEGEAGAGMVVIHRIVGLRDGRFVTQGDNNPELDPWTIDAGDIRGEAALRIPRAGSVTSQLQSPVGLAGVFGSLAGWVAMGALPKKRRPAHAATRRHPPTPLGEPGRPPRAATSPPAT